MDIVLSGERGLKAIAAKRASRVRDDDLVPLRTLQQDYPMAQAWRVYAPGEPWLAGP